MEERLQKLLARAGYGSRRACEDLILQRRVAVNGNPAELGQKADPAVDRITVDGDLLPQAERLTYIALHKPVGVVSSAEAQGDRQTVLDLVPTRVRLYPVGRLDLDSEGLMLLTNDGSLTNRLTHPRYDVDKEYRVLVKGEPNQDQLDAWRRGVVLIDQETGKRLRTRPAHVKREAPAGDHTWLRVTMQEGRKHEIRDIGATLGLPVVRLIRVRLASLLLGDLRPGEWRALKPAEVKALATGAPPPAEAGRRGGERRLAKPADGRRPPKPPDGRRPTARTRQNPTRRAAKRG